MGEAFITRRGGVLKNLKVETLEPYKTDSSYSYKGFNFNNNTYYIRFYFTEGSDVYFVEYIIKNGVATTYRYSGYGTTYNGAYYIKSLEINVDTGELYVDRRYATVIIKPEKSTCISIEG